jgi:hypothetical protein
MRLRGTCTFGIVSLAACGSSDSSSSAPSGGDAASSEAGSTPALDSGKNPSADASGAESGATGMDAAAGIDGGSAQCKRGIATNAAPSAAFVHTGSSPGVAWWYDWSAQGQGGSSGIEFVPMIWGSATLQDALPAGSKYVLGFNEPNFKAQANLTPQQAAAGWPTIEVHAKAAGIPIVSPAVNFCGSASNPAQCTDPTITDPYTYLKDFFAACSGCEVDYVAVHWYNCDLPSLKAYLEGNTQTGGTLQGFVQFGKPIWLTEFSCDPTHSVADQTAYMQAAVPYLEGNPHIFRYSWFSANAIPNALLAKADGSPTALGSTYIGLPRSCP